MRTWLAFIIALVGCSDHTNTTTSSGRRVGASETFNVPGSLTVHGVAIFYDTEQLQPSSGGTVGSPPSVDSYNGNPNGVVTANKGSFIVDFSTPGLWQNATGGTTWTAVGGGSPGGTPDYGPGTDGAPTFDGTSTVLGLSPSSSNCLGGTSNCYSLARPLFTSGATVNASVEVKLNGFYWEDNGSGVNNGYVDDDGYSTSGRSSEWYPATIGESSNSSDVIGPPIGSASSGGTGGTASPSPPGTTPGGPGGTGGKFTGGGGGGADGAGSAGGSVTVVSTSLMGPLYDMLKRGAAGQQFSSTLSAGAGGGTGSVGACGGGGSFGVGAGGTGGGFAFVLWKSPSGTGLFSANGGSGGAGCSCNNPSANASGGGGGGGAGYCYFGYSHRSGSVTCQSNGGSGGAAGGGTCVNGGAGGSGGSGFTWNDNISNDGS